MPNELASWKKISDIKCSFAQGIIKEDVVDLRNLHKWQDFEVDQKITSVWGEMKYI